MKQSLENLCFLLFKAESRERQHWPDYLKEWARCSRERAEALLAGEDLTDAEQEAIVTQCDLVSTEQLQYERLLEPALKQDDDYVLRQNLKYLINTLPHGKKKELADAAKVKPITISRWLNDETDQLPTPAHQIAISKYFCLDADVDLATTLLFLSQSPASDRQRRNWVHQQIDALTPERLRELFPGLQAMLTNTPRHELD